VTTVWLGGTAGSRVSLRAADRPDGYADPARFLVMGPRIQPIDLHPPSRTAARPATADPGCLFIGWIRMSIIGTRAGSAYSAGESADPENPPARPNESPCQAEQVPGQAEQVPVPRRTSPTVRPNESPNRAEQAYGQAGEAPDQAEEARARPEKLPDQAGEAPCQAGGRTAESSYILSLGPRA
jgi:hypothetical protein